MKALVVSAHFSSQKDEENLQVLVVSKLLKFFNYILQNALNTPGATNTLVSIIKN